MKTGFCGKGGQRVPVGTGQGHVRIREHDRRRHGAVSAARAARRWRARRRRAGRSRRPPRPAPATPRRSRSRTAGREIRVYGGEVESLTRGDRARRRGAGLDRDRASATPTAPISPTGAGGDRRRAAEAAAVADEDEFAAARPEPPSPRRSTGLSDPSVLETGHRGRSSSSRCAVERTALDADPRIAGVEQAVYADERRPGRDRRPRTGVAGSYEASSCLRLPAGDRRGRWGQGDRPRLRAGARPGGARRRRRSAREARRARASR